MKKVSIKSYILLCFVALNLLSSCDSFLDRQEDEIMTFDKIWQQRGTTRQYWLNAMGFLPNDADDWRYLPWVGASDEGTVTYNGDYRWINFGSWSPTSIPQDRFAYYYKGIRECNIFLQNADRCSDPELTAEELGQWKVQARFARAYYYFLLMRTHGPIFLLGDDLIDFTATTQELERPRNTWEECVKYVTDEMNACIANPMMKSTWDTEAEKGLATKGAAQAVISRLKLYSARNLFNGNKLYASVVNPDGKPLFPQTYDARKWLEAAQAARVLIDNSQYKLYRSANNDPYENYLGITDANWNDELIWSTGYSGRYNVGVHTAPTALSGTAYGGVGPTQQQVDAYAMKNGRYPITGYKNDGTPIIDNESGYSEDGKSTWSYPAWGGYKTYSRSMPNMYKNREARFYITIFFGDSYWYYGDKNTLVSFCKGANANKSHDYPKSGYLVNRFYDHKQNSASGQWGNWVFPTFRLGEIYLNYIEAVLECKKRGVSMPADYETKAMEVWNDLRDRAGLKSITTIYPNATTDELIELCRKERRVELAFENHRYFDTRTWMIAEQTDGGPMYGMNVDAPSSGTTTVNDFWKRSVFETRVFKSNHYLYPFPQRELDRNKKLTQNYGW